MHNHYRLSSAGREDQVLSPSPAWAAWHVQLPSTGSCTQQCRDLMGLSGMMMLKVLKKEPVWSLSLTQAVSKLTQLSLDASPLMRCLRSPFPQPIKRLQTGKVTGYHNNQNWWLLWKLFGAGGGWYNLKYHRNRIDPHYASMLVLWSCQVDLTVLRKKSQMQSHPKSIPSSLWTDKKDSGGGKNAQRLGCAPQHILSHSTIVFFLSKLHRMATVISCHF